MEATPGQTDQIIAGRYRLVELIGRGGMGCVWRAEHLTLHTPVAIKLLTPSPSDRQEAHARFAREAQSAATLKSTNVVHILDYGVDADVPYIAMEYLEGESLKAYLKHKGRLSPAETAAVMRGVLRAVARAHRAGIVHRDLKPDNVFLASEGDGESTFVVKVLDFGIAKLIERSDASEDVATRTGAMLGTPYYMSPEQARGRRDLDARSDLWSLAAIVFECLLGRRPFEADVIGDLVMRICADPIPRPSDFGPVPPGFDDWFARATQRAPAARWANAHDFAAALADVLAPGERWLDAREDGASNGGGRLSLPAVEAAPAHGTTGSASSRSLPPAGAPRAAGRTRAILTVVGLVALVAAGLGVRWVMTAPVTAPTSAPSDARAGAAEPPVDPRGSADATARVVSSTGDVPPSAAPPSPSTDDAAPEAPSVSAGRSAAPLARRPSAQTTPSALVPTAIPTSSTDSPRDPLRDL